MKNPLRSKRVRAREILADMDTCQGQIEALLDIRHHTDVEKVTGPLDQGVLIELKTALETARWDLDIMAARGIGEISNDVRAASNRRFQAEDNTKAEIKTEIGKTGGLRGMIGMHRKNAGIEICAGALRTLQAGAKLTGKDPGGITVDDPFGRPEPAADMVRTNWNEPEW